MVGVRVFSENFLCSYEESLVAAVSKFRAIHSESVKNIDLTNRKIVENIIFEYFGRPVREISYLESSIDNMPKRKNKATFVFLFEIDGAAIFVKILGDRIVKFRVGAETRRACNKIILGILGKLPKVKINEDSSKMDLHFWYTTKHGLSCTTKSIDCPNIDVAKRNYGEVVFRNIEALSKLESPWENGKIILWHGPPGTGKTNAIKILSSIWKEKFKNISTEFLIQPEEFIGNTQNLVKLFLERDEFLGNEEGEEPLRLVIIEDRADLFSANCRNNPAFSVLLNLADGLIGHGSKVIFMITANEKVDDSFDEAVTRSGRCLDITHFGRLSIEESESWLADQEIDQKVTAPMTLAELYALKNNRVLKSHKPEDFGF